MAVTAFSPEIEAECDALYKRMYAGEEFVTAGGLYVQYPSTRGSSIFRMKRLTEHAAKNTDSEPGMAVTAFSPEIEAECDALYKRMYEQERRVRSPGRC
jgi:CCR4-NOT transcription complex subunit 1